MKSLPVVNLEEARFECTFGRGCEGICCQNGRPGVYPEEQSRIEKNLKKFIPQLLPRAQKVIQKSGIVSNRTKGGLKMLRVVDGWCIFFNKGCVLHKVGSEEGDKYRYKPAPCALFPVNRDGDAWYIRQWGYQREEWDLFCLKPTTRTPPAADHLQEEIALAARYMKEEGRQKKAESRAKKSK